MQRRDYLTALFEQQRFGDFQFQPLGRQAGMFQRVHHRGQEIADPELQRRQIDRDPHRIGPGRSIKAGAAQHLQAERIDQPGFFRHRNEIGRRHHAALRMRPAHQRLAAGNRAGAEPDQRLIMRPQHFMLQRLPQLELDLAAGLGARVHAGLEERIAAARFHLGLGERHIGAHEQLVGFVAVARRHRNADAGADHHRMAIDQKRLADRMQQSLGQQHDILGALDAALQHRELIGVQPADHVVVAQRRTQPAGNAAQQLVADRVTEAVIDRLEIVDAEEMHRDLAVAAPGVRQHVIEPLAQRIAVRQPGEAVVLRHEGEPHLGALALGDIHQRQQHRRLAVIGQLARIDRKIDQRAVGADVFPGARGALIGARIAVPGPIGLEGLQVAEGQRAELGRRIAVMLDRGIIDADDAFAVDRADDHRHGVAVEQKPE